MSRWTITGILIVVVAVSAGIVVASSAGGDDQPVSCLFVGGCDSGVMVLVPRSERPGHDPLTICVDAKCIRTGRRYGALAQFARRPVRPGVVNVVLIRDRSDGPAQVTTARAALRHRQLHGPCGYNCWSAFFVYRDGALVVDRPTDAEARQLVRTYGSLR